MCNGRFNTCNGRFNPWSAEVKPYGIGEYGDTFYSSSSLLNFSCCMGRPYIALRYYLDLVTLHRLALKRGDWCQVHEESDLHTVSGNKL
eukprot:6207806-Pleurochrysis_carterae.AAC.4